MVKGEREGRRVRLKIYSCAVVCVCNSMYMRYSGCVCVCHTVFISHPQHLCVRALQYLCVYLVCLCWLRDLPQDVQ
jgi:hypothetical protein